MIKIKDILPFFIIVITFISVNQWSALPLSNVMIEWFIAFLTIITVIVYTRNATLSMPSRYFPMLNLYFGWLIFEIIRGGIIADGYWEYKQLIAGSLALSIPVFVFPYSNPLILGYTLRKWMKYAFPAFFIFFIWVLKPGNYHFYLGPVILLCCFLPVLKKKWRIIFIILLLVMMFSDLGARSQVIKSFVALILNFVYVFYRVLSFKFIKYIYVFCCFIPFILIALGVKGHFNVFTDIYSDDDYTQQKIVNGKTVTEDLSADTRTLLYSEVISSAIKNRYVIIGRTPARGNDSKVLGDKISQAVETNHQERHYNEMVFPNVFTWLGLIGLILYFLIYIRSGYLAIYRSNNIYLKVLGLFIGFHIIYGWVEDFNKFDIMNISLWMAIAMGYSEELRRMNNNEFVLWINTIFR